MSLEKEVPMTILMQIEQTYSGNINMDGTIHKISALKTMGAYGFQYDEKSISFKIQGNGEFIMIKITLNSGDLYDIELINKKGDIIDEYNDIFFSELGNLLVKEVLYK
jgi:dissimilatory sulfite reductase (desulfoviridin) alpha/beta subunit